MRFHGGSPPVEALDFSAPSNPLGPPPALHEAVREAVELGVYTRYPEPGYRRLREALASFYRVEPESLVVFNGAAEALQLIVFALKPSRLIVVEPTFGDHHLHVLVARTPLVRIALREEGDRYRLEPGDILSMPPSMLRGSLLLLSNPNNPTGACTNRKTLLELLDVVSRHGALLVVDESFAEISLCRESLLGVEHESLVVVRSPTKSLSAPGLRLGFVYARGRRVVERLEAARQAWNVNSIAAYVAERLYGEQPGMLRSHFSNAVELLRVELAFLEKGLKRLGLHVYRSTAPLLLFRGSVPHPLLTQLLLEKRVYVRDASSYPFLTPLHTRVSVRTRRENQVLISALREVLGR